VRVCVCVPRGIKSVSAGVSEKAPGDQNLILMTHWLQEDQWQSPQFLTIFPLTPPQPFAAGKLGMREFLWWSSWYFSLPF